MTQKEKQLLLKDLCARLPYGTICNDIHGDSIVTYIDLEKACVYLPDFDECRSIDDIKPYLRPMSSMTEEERKEINKAYNFSDFGSVTIHYHKEGWWDNDTECNLKDYLYLINWLNEHHFDYRELLEKGLALEAPEGMYKTE